MPETYLVTNLIHSSGQSLCSSCRLPFDPKPAFKTGELPIPLTMQERGSIISYFRRYCIACMLGIVGEEDDDANTADGNAMERKQPESPVKQTTNSQRPPAPEKPLPTQQDHPQEDKLPFPTSEQPMQEPIDIDALKQAIEQCKSIQVLKEWGLDYKTNIKTHLKQDEQTEISVAYLKQKEILGVK